MTQIPTKQQHPNGLHRRYYIQKIDGIRYVRDNMLGEAVYEPVLKEVDKDAEYFVLRLDSAGSDPRHIDACRRAVHTYAEAIKDHLPELAKDLIERYPMIH